MNDAAATKTPEVVLAQRLLAFRLLPTRLPAQYGINLAKLLNVPSVLVDQVVGLTAKTWRLEVLSALKNLCGHLVGEAGVVIVQHLQGFLMLIFGFAHSRLSFVPE